MNAGRIAVSFILVVSLLFGAGFWYTAERAYYEPVVFQPGAEVRLVSLASGQPEPIEVEAIEGTDAQSSPIKFRACFRTPVPLATLTATYRRYENAEPLIAPRAFPCFDAAAIGAALEAGEAVAFLSEPGIHPGVDRIVAVFPDGRGYAWHQLQPEPVVLPVSGQDVKG